MGVFICWSGDRSKAIAQALQTLLRSILSPPSIFLSETCDWVSRERRDLCDQCGPH